MKRTDERFREELHYGQECWVISSGKVELSLTKTGGHTAPVYFFRDTDAPLQPYYINPWYEDASIEDAAIRVIRGNFFCLPFGGESTHQGVRYVTHGETASRQWSFAERTDDGKSNTLTVKMETGEPQGRVEKRITLVEGENNVYTRHILTGYSGSFSLGYHATLALPERERAMAVSKAPGYTAFTPEVPLCRNGEDYSSLKGGLQLSDLTRTSTVWKDPDTADCTLFPDRRGFSDTLLVYDAPLKQADYPSWTAAAVPSEGYLWFSLKNSAVLPSTMFWISNGGRKFSPWLGRNRCLGLEDVCGYFAEGQAQSVRMDGRLGGGSPTVRSLSGLDGQGLNYIEGAVRIPEGFSRTAEVRFLPQAVQFISTEGITVETGVNWEFIVTGNPRG